MYVEMSYIYIDYFNFQVNDEQKKQEQHVIKDGDGRKREEENRILGQSHVYICMNNWSIHTQ